MIRSWILYHRHLENRQNNMVDILVKNDWKFKNQFILIFTNNFYYVVLCIFSKYFTLFIIKHYTCISKIGDMYLFTKYFVTTSILSPKQAITFLQCIYLPINIPLCLNSGKKVKSIIICFGVLHVTWIPVTMTSDTHLEINLFAIQKSIVYN